MFKKPILAIVLVATALAVAATVAPDVRAGTQERFTIPVDGAQVAPGPGDPDGGGGIFIFLDRQTGRFCLFADTANISTPLTSVDLHRAPAGSAGPIVTPLHGPSATDPDVSGCLDLDPDLVKEISKHKAEFYIDIHNEEFPGAALRGQLG
jgi:hypothetical protein